MEVSDAIRKRRSIKKYSDIPVEWDKIGSILDSGRLAPSAGNLQPWHFVVVLSDEKRKSISNACFQQYWMQSAPVHIVICAQFTKMTRFYGVRGERLYAIQSCSLAAANMIYEGVNQGLGTNFVSAFDEEMLSAAIGVPDFARPQAVLTFGYAAEKVPTPPKYTLNDVVGLEGFGSKMKDPLGYMGYGWGKNIKNVVLGSKDVFDKMATQGSKRLKEFSEKIKSKK